MTVQIGAIPSWSGYIFQGEVAICRALETINSLDEIQDNFYLGIEDEEDFAIYLPEKEVFQVKAYASSSFSKYRGVIEGLIMRHTYGVQIEKDPDDGRRNIYTRNENPADSPTKSFLISWMDIEEFEETDIHEDYRDYVNDDNHFELVQGIYTLENIEDKIQQEVRKLLTRLGEEINDKKVEIIQRTICHQICSKVKEFHSNNENKLISFNDIIQWITDCPNSVSSSALKHALKRIFLNQLKDQIRKLYEIENSENDIERLESAEEKLSEIDEETFVDELLKLHLIPHREINKQITLDSFGEAIDVAALREIVFKGIRSIESEPDYAKLVYWSESGDVPTSYQLTTINSGSDEEDILYTSELQEICEKLYDSSVSADTDFFITQHLDKDKDKVAEILNEIMDVEPSKKSPTDALGSPLDKFNLFGLVKLKTAVDKL